MALFQKLQRTVCKLTRPVVQKANTTELAQSEEDEETCDYAVALQSLLGRLKEKQQFLIANARKEDKEKRAERDLH